MKKIAWGFAPNPMRGRSSSHHLLLKVLRGLVRLRVQGRSRPLTAVDLARHLLHEAHVDNRVVGDVLREQARGASPRPWRWSSSARSPRPSRLHTSSAIDAGKVSPAGRRAGMVGNSARAMADRLVRARRGRVSGRGSELRTNALDQGRLLLDRGEAAIDRRVGVGSELPSARCRKGSSPDPSPHALRHLRLGDHGELRLLARPRPPACRPTRSPTSLTSAQRQAGFRQHVAGDRIRGAAIRAGGDRLAASTSCAHVGGVDGRRRSPRRSRRCRDRRCSPPTGVRRRAAWRTRRVRDRR